MTERGATDLCGWQQDLWVLLLPLQLPLEEQLLLLQQELVGRLGRIGRRWVVLLGIGWTLPGKWNRRLSEHGSEQFRKQFTGHLKQRKIAWSGQYVIY